VREVTRNATLRAVNNCRPEAQPARQVAPSARQRTRTRNRSGTAMKGKTDGENGLKAAEPPRPNPHFIEWPGLSLSCRFIAARCSVPFEL